MISVQTAVVKGSVETKNKVRFIISVATAVVKSSLETKIDSGL